MEMEDSSAEAGDTTVFLEAVELYLQGKDAEGLAKLQSVLASDPDGPTALAMRDAVGYDFWARLLTKGGDHETAAQDILRRARIPAKERRMDASAIRKLVAELTLRDGRVVYDLNGITRPDWTTLPRDYRQTGEAKWDAITPAPVRRPGGDR